MSRRDDDLSPFRDDPVYRALTAPGTADELAGEAEVLAAFRATNASRPMRRFAVRLGTGGTVAVATLVLTGGVAAAYTASLPAPLQRIAHDAGGPLGIPAPTLRHHSGSGGSTSKTSITEPAPSIVSSPNAAVASGGTPTTGTTPTTSPSASPTSSPAVSPTVPVIVVSTPATTPSPMPSDTTSLVGASLAITATPATPVAVGSTVTLTGQLDTVDGTPVEGRRVVLLQRSAGDPHWVRVGDVGVTSDAGSVTFTTAPIERNARLVLRLHHRLRSAVVKVVATPTINEVVTPSETVPGQATVTVTVVGGDDGDVLGLNRLSGPRQHRQATLDETGTATFTITLPTRRTASYRLFLRGTQAHGVSTAQFTVPVPGATPSD